MKTILVVDDDDGVGALVRDILVLEGYTVLDTSDPQEALRIASQQAIHLLLTDVVMPLMRGTELVRRLEAISPRTKVLLMSAYTPGEVNASTGHFRRDGSARVAFGAQLVPTRRYPRLVRSSGGLYLTVYVDEKTRAFWRGTSLF